MSGYDPMNDIPQEEDEEYAENFMRQRVAGRKRRGATPSKSGLGKGRGKNAFQSYRGNEPPSKTNKTTPAWSKFGEFFGSRTVTLTDKKRLKALAKLGGATGVSAAGYSILAGWLDDAAEHQVIARVRHVLDTAAQSGVKTKIFGSHQTHFDIINSNQALATPLNVSMPSGVKSKITDMAIHGRANYQKNKEKIDQAKPIMDAYRIAPHVTKELYKAVKLFYKEHPGLSASKLKVSSPVRLDSPHSLIEYLRHHYPDMVVPPQVTVVRVLQGNISAALPAQKQFFEMAPAWNKYDALIAINALSSNKNMVQVYSALSTELKLIIARFAKQALTVINKVEKQIHNPSPETPAIRAMMQSFYRAISLGYLLKNTPVGYTSEQLNAGLQQVTNTPLEPLKRQAQILATA